MPALEMAQETGRLVKWRKQQGEPVTKGELLMDVETDKAVVEIEAEADGVLSNVTASEGDVVTVGQVIAWILAPGETAPEVANPAASGRTQPTATTANVPARAPAPAGTADRPLMSPKARRLAAEQGLDPRALAVSGTGVITAKDVDQGTAPASRSETPGTIWRVMAERMSAAWTTVPQFHVTRQVDATALVTARQKINAEAAANVTYTDLLVVAVARTLRRHPLVNASWAEGRVRYHTDINVGIATAVEQGVTVPVLHAADTMTVSEVASRRADLVARARAGRLKPADLSGGRFTISNLGAYHVDTFTAIVNPPEAAILAVGAIRERVVASEGRAVVKPTLALTLSCDHRVLDGARGAAFLHDLVVTIENGEGIA
jgi:pyruvate dehydrogenase E2 component (dihydrolipoamide acetyltransferase)